MSSRFVKTARTATLIAGLLLGLLGTAVADPCKHTDPKTKLVKDACAAGGQAAAKEAMKKWTKAAKAQKPSLDCKTCHAKLAPGYELKADGLKLFNELGGK